MKDAYVDAVFDDGCIFRCQTQQDGSDLYGCTDTAEGYRGLMRQFLQGSVVHCNHCSVHVETDAAAWRAQAHDLLDDSKQISVTHHGGGEVLVRASLDTGTSVERRFVSADLVQILDCAS